MCSREDSNPDLDALDGEHSKPNNFTLRQIPSNMVLSLAHVTKNTPWEGELFWMSVSIFRAF